MTGKTQEEQTYDALSIEELFSRLEEISGALESGEGSLEEAFALYKEGVRILKACSGKIDRVEKQLLVLEEEEEADEL